MGSTLESASAPSRSMMPPCRSFCVGRWCFLTMLTCSTTTRPLSVRTWSTLPRLPRSRPAMTPTVSPRRTWIDCMSEDLGCQRNDLGELPLPQLAGDRPEDPGADRVLVGLDQDDGVAVEADVGAVPTADLLDRAHDDRSGHLALLHGAVRRRLLDGHDHGVAQRGVALVGTAHDPDALDLLGPRV